MKAWSLQGLTVCFPGIVAVREVDLDVHPGERLGIVGASGSGKTTLTRAGLGLMPADSGTVSVLGEPTAGWPERRWVATRRKVQLLFQDPDAMLHPALSLGLLLADSAAVHRPGEDPDAAAQGALAAVGLADRADARPHELSGGERRRAGLARILLTRPQLLVADEPTAGLDAELKADLLGLLLDQLDSRCAFVLVTHDLALVRWACTRVVVMHQGQIVDEILPRDLHRADHPVTRALARAAGLLQELT